jgi:hypothetical protein
MWQCFDRRGSAAIIVAVLPLLWQCCHCCGSAAIVVAVLPSLWLYFHRVVVLSLGCCSFIVWMCSHHMVVLPLWGSSVRWQLFFDEALSSPFHLAACEAGLSLLSFLKLTC